MWDPYAEFQSATLPNGLTVHVAHWPGRPWEAMGFLIHSGAEYDPIGLEGLSHFVEHLVSENTNVPKKDMIAFFNGCGGTVNLGMTGYPCTDYRFFVPTDKAILAKAFSMFGNMLLSVRLEKFIERERQVIIAEFRHRFPAKFMLDLAVREHKALYTGYWLERFVNPFGNLKSITRITQSELRSHYDAHYTPANMSVVGVGGMSLQEIEELLSESPFAANKEGVRTPLPSPASDVAPPSEARYVFEISQYFTKTVLPEVGGYRSVAKIPGNVNARAIRIINEMLDEVLNEEVRERRAWAYVIDSSRYNFRHFHKFSINCRVFVDEALDGIEDVVEVCIASIVDRIDLLEQAKRRALANYCMIDPTGQGICDGALDDLADNQRIISLAECQNDIERVTMGDVHSLIQWLRPEQRWTCITRP